MMDFDSTNLLVAIISAIATVVSTIIAIYQAKRAQKWKEQNKRLTWEDIEVGMQDILDKVEADFKPELMLCLSERGAAVVSVVFAKFGRTIPLYVGFWEASGAANVDVSDLDFIELRSRNRKFYLPKGVLGAKGKKILIVDDWAYTGQAISNTMYCLTASGISIDDIRCATLVASPAAKSSFTVVSKPFYSYYEFPDNKFFFPWGKAS